MVKSEKGSTRYSNYLEDYWPFAGALSAMNAIGTQLRDPIDSGPTRWRWTMYVDYDAATESGRNPVSKHQPIRFNLSVENERADAGRDGKAEPVSRDQISRRERGQGKTHFPCSADHEQVW